MVCSEFASVIEKGYRIEGHTLVSIGNRLLLKKKLENTGLFDLSGYGPKVSELLETLAQNRWAVDGFELIRTSAIPDLDDPCCQSYTFRELIECGETQARTGLQNLPKQPESYAALHDLGTQILDPVIDYFGSIELTYGFCSPELAKKIAGRIDPKRDQHFRGGV